MKPDLPCVNHPDSESDRSCRYCGDGFCSECLSNLQVETGFYRCRKEECEKAFPDELVGPQRPCPFCGHDMPVPFPVCQACGKKSEPVPDPDPESLVTVAKFSNVTEAQLARTKLSSEGIQAFVADENMNAIYAAGNFFLDGVRLQACAADASKALQILNLSPGSRICPFCGLEVHAPFLFCGHCGKELEKTSETRVFESEEEKEKRRPSTPRWEFEWAVLFWLALTSVYVLPMTIYSEFFLRKGILPNPNWYPKIECFLNSLTVILICYCVKRLKSLSWLKTIQFLGFKSINFRQILAGFLILIPVFVGNFLSYQGYQKEGVLLQVRHDWMMHFFLIFVIGAGILEEVFFRGFLFQCLRPGRSFLEASILSAGFWSISHLLVLLPFNTPIHLSFRELLIFLPIVFVDGIRGAYLFERGGNIIWGFMLVHVGIDLDSVINTQGGDFYVSDLPEDFHLAGWILSVALTIPIVRWLLPDKKNEKTEEPKKKGIKRILRENAISTLWGPALLSIVLCTVIALGLFMISGQRLSEAALDNQYQYLIQSHPRYADGYRTWAHDLYLLGKYNDAGETCRQALAIDPKNAKAWLLWGKSLEKMQKYEDAVPKFQKVVELEPGNTVAYLWWGHTLDRWGKRDEAAKEFEAALQLKPEESYFADYAKKALARIQLVYLKS